MYDMAVGWHHVGFEHAEGLEPPTSRYELTFYLKSTFTKSTCDHKNGPIYNSFGLNLQWIGHIWYYLCVIFNILNKKAGFMNF